MSGTDGDLAHRVSALVDALEDLQRELEPGDRRRLRPPTPGELSWLTSEVTIPAAIVVLETNVRVLRLLQRTIRLADGRDRRAGGSRARLRTEATTIGRESLDQLERTLAELQSAAGGRAADEEVDRLVRRARELRDEVDARLAAEAPADGEADPLGRSREPVDVDVDAEIDAIRREVDGEDGPDDERPDAGE